jgi:hypothetical protein
MGSARWLLLRRSRATRFAYQSPPRGIQNQQSRRTWRPCCGRHQKDPRGNDLHRSVREMAAVVRWATDVYIDFLYLHPELVTAKARWGLEIMEDVKNRFNAHWSEVPGTIERNDLWDEYSSRTLSMRKILCLFLRRLYNHHTQIPDLKNSF